MKKHILLKFSLLPSIEEFLPILVLLPLLISLLISCNTTEPPGDQTLTLTLEDVSCTEAWIQLTTNNLQLPATINLLKNNTVAQTFSLSTKDSLLYIDSLLPNQNYSFQVSSIEYPVSPGGTGNISSNKLTVTTMDTTSHEFTWQSWDFGGDCGSSSLYDVAIIDENNIWAVGEIYLRDSLGNYDPNAYNAVHWDGTKWELIRIPVLVNTTIFYPPITTIIAFGINDIWFGGVHWDGTKYTLKNNGWPLLPNGDGWRVNKMWGTSSSDLYAVGNNGNIAHYQNGSWKKIESGTTSIINDVWGITNELNKTILYCAVSSFFVPGDKKILKITDAKVDSVNWNKDVRLYSAWTNNDNFIYVCGEGVYVYKFGTWEQITLPAITSNSIRGTDINDVFAVGSMGTIFHFNGISWKVISSYTQKENYRVDFKNNVVAVCGYYNGKGFVEIGRRN
jgi:hypothetical protein